MSKKEWLQEALAVVFGMGAIFAAAALLLLVRSIIAGDDAVAPVLGYTSTGTFDAGNLPDGLKGEARS